MSRLKEERIDSVAMLVFFPVPPEIFKETEEQIHMEMAILKAHGHNPATVACTVADKILRKGV